MTPDEARALLDGTTPGPWFFDDDMAGRMHKIGPIVPAGTELECTTDDAALAAHAPDMAATIAGMTCEYAVEMYHEAAGAWIRCTDWVGVREVVEQRLGDDDRIVRRYVTEPEEA